MDGHQSRGIIFKQYLPYKQKVIVLDYELGKVVAVPDSAQLAPRLCRGAYITYELKQRQMNYFLHNVDIAHVPFEWARADIVFYHQIVEICLFFLPLEQPNTDVFHLLVAWYKAMAQPEQGLMKKIFLVKLFLILGLYPEDTPPKLHALAALSIDDILCMSVRLPIRESEVDVWLLSCTKMHPQVALFKTLHF